MKMKAAAPVDPTPAPAVDPTAAACAAAAAEMKTVCGDAYAAIDADVKAGKLTPVEAAAAFADAAVKCSAQGAKMGAACSGPWGPAPAVPVAPVGVRVVDAKAPKFELDKCAVALVQMKAICQDSYAKIDADVKAGKLTPAEASAAFAKVATECKAEYPKMGAACAKPKPPA